MKEVMKQYDAIIIGFGKAGKTLAAELSNRGWQVAVVERSSMMYGGTCPNIACIPTKTLVHEAGIAALLYHDDYPKQANLYKQAIGRKNRLTSFLRNNNYERLSKRPNVTVYTGEGSFVSANIIKVALPEGDIELQGKEIFINTGSTPIIPAIDGIKESQKVYTSTTLLDLNVLPQHLIIVGGGYIGLEFASMYAEFGSKVTLLEGGNRFMPRNDQDIANSVKEVLEKKGIEIHLNARAQSIHDTNDGVTLTYSDVSDGTPYFVDGDAILIATGRKPMIEGLNLQAAGIGVDAHGAIVVSTIFGRRRYLNDISSHNAVARGLAERNAVNAPIQGSAADIMKIAMIDVHRRFAAEGIRSRVILQVHDELVVDMLRSEQERVTKIVTECMESAAQLKVRLIADAGIGGNWLEAH